MSIRSDEPLSAGSGPGPVGGRGRADEAGAADAVVGPSVSGSAGAAVSSGGALGGGAVGDPPDGGLGRGTASSPAGPDDGPRADGPSVAGRLADDPVGELPADGPVGDLPDNDPVDDLPVVDPVDDLPAVADGEGMSPVVREYTERLRREALARDAELRARGIDPYKGTGVDEGPRRRLGARPGGAGRPGGGGCVGGGVCGVLAGGARLRDEPRLPGPVRRKFEAPARHRQGTRQTSGDDQRGRGRSGGRSPLLPQHLFVRVEHGGYCPD